MYTHIYMYKQMNGCKYEHIRVHTHTHTHTYAPQREPCRVR